MKFSIKVLTLYLLISTPSFAEIKPMVNVCKEDSFLKCTNKTKKDCENAFNLSATYCDKKLDKTIDWNNIRDSMKTHTECINSSSVAYFDGDSKKLYACLSKTGYMKRFEINMYIDIIIQAVRNLSVAPLTYIIGLIIYYIIACLLIYLIFKKIIKKSNNLKSIIYRALTISIAISPTVMFGGGVAVFSPALFAIAASLFYGELSVSVQGIIIPIISIFLIIVTFLYFTGANKNKNA